MATYQWKIMSRCEKLESPPQKKTKIRAVAVWDQLKWSLEHPIVEQILEIPSGKHTKNYGTSPFFNGKIHYFYGHFQ